MAALFGDHAKTLIGAAANRANLQKNWAAYRYLHFATHAVLNEASPFYSSVVLSRGNGPNDEGQLFAHDLLEADLSAELAVLSACETGLGQQQNGEGVVGMSWSWFVSGVPSLVVSQWKVDDAPTATLMTTFWEKVHSGTPKAEALRQAQRMLLKDKKTRHPFYWAPFILIGDFGK